MRVHAQKQSKPQPEASPRPGRLTYLTLRNQVTPGSTQAHAEARTAEPYASAATGVEHDFSRIPLHPKAAIQIQRKVRVKDSDSGEYADWTPDESFREAFKAELKKEGYDAKKGLGIMDELLASQDTFDYDDVEVLKKEVKYRLKSVSLMETDINKIKGFGQWGTKATDYWEMGAGMAPGFTLKKQEGSDKNKDAAAAVKALVDPANALTVDCSTALAVLEVLTVMKELGGPAFSKLYETRPLTIQPLKAQELQQTKKFKDTDLLKLFKSQGNNQSTVVSSLEELIPGDRGHFMNFTTMRRDPYAAEYVLYMGKKGGKHMFRGHPYHRELSYEEMVEDLLKHYLDMRKARPEQTDEIALQEEFKAKNQLLYPDIIGGYAPGLYKVIERPSVVNLYQLK